MYESGDLRKGLKIEIENGIVIKTTIINNRNNSESTEDDNFIIW